MEHSSNSQAASSFKGSLGSVGAGSSVSSMLEALGAASSFKGSLGSVGAGSSVSSMLEALGAASSFKGSLGSVGAGSSVSSMLEALGAASSFKGSLGSVGAGSSVSSMLEALGAASSFKGSLGSVGAGSSVSSMLEALGAASSFKGSLGSVGAGSSVSSMLEARQQGFAPGTSDGRYLVDALSSETPHIPARQPLELTLPLGHDLAARAALQLVVVAFVAAALFGINMLGNPVFTTAAAVLAAAGTPKPVEVWRATGQAYDRLYGGRNFRRERDSTREALGSKSRW